MLKNIDNIIEDFSSNNFVVKFLNDNKDKLDIIDDVSSIDMEIYHKRYKEYSKRLIVTYSFVDKGITKRRTAKIRIFKDNNLAKKSWIMSNSIWGKLSDEYKYIARPLHYFDEYELFVYETAEGRPLSDMLKDGSISDDELSEKIKTATKYLAKLHMMDASNFKVDYLNGYNTVGQVDSFYEFLKTSNKAYSDEVRGIVGRTLDELKKFSETRKTLIHGDFQIENFIFNEKDLKIIDFDFSEINDPLIDVGNFLVQIFYGGIMGDRVSKYRKIFLDYYLECNTDLDKNFINERINLYTVIAKIRNISYKMLMSREMEFDDLEGVRWDIKRVEKRLDNLSGDPLSFF